MNLFFWSCEVFSSDLYHASAISHKNKTFCTSSLAVKNLRTSLYVQKQSFLFSGDSTWLARDKGLLRHFSTWPLNRLFQSAFPGIAGLHFIAASSVLYANEKNIYYDPDYLSGLSRTRLYFFPTTFLEIAVCKWLRFLYITQLQIQSVQIAWIFTLAGTKI